MSNENKNLNVVSPDAKQPSTVDNPFLQKKSEHIMHGAVQIEESRAIAEAQGKLIIAKKFPRDEAAAFEQVMISCSRWGLADAAMYAYPRGTTTVTGPSIRLAEELARAWGNIDFGIRELSQQDGISELEAYCWDLQTNTHSSFKFTVKHERHTNEYINKQKTGRVIVTKLTDPRDIFELCANQGSRRLRARILSVLPPDLIEAAIERCKATLAGSGEVPLQDRVKKMIVAFNSYGVSKAHIETRIGAKVETILPEQLVELISIFNSIKDGMKSASDWFGKDAEAAPDAIAALNEEGTTNKPKTTRATKKNEATAPAEETGPKNEPARPEVKAEPPAAKLETKTPAVDPKKVPPGSPIKAEVPPAEQPTIGVEGEDDLPPALFPEEDVV